MDKETFKALSVHNKKYKSIVILCKVSLKREFICVLLYKQEKKKEGNCKGGDNKAWISCSVQLLCSGYSPACCKVCGRFISNCFFLKSLL